MANVGNQEDQLTQAIANGVGIYVVQVRRHAHIAGLPVQPTHRTALDVDDL